MNLANLNLNLLTALDALLRERSVTNAAGKLGLSQPALSASLARLRRHFNDPLLVRVGNSYELTPFAEQLGERTGAAMAGVQRVFSVAPTFDPAASDRAFSILVADYALGVLGAGLSRIVAERAPGVRVEFHPHTPRLIERADEVLREVDAMILPRGFLSGLPHLDLFTDTWVCVVDEDHPTIGDTVTLAELGRSPWVVSFRSSSAFTPPMRQLENLGVDVQVQVVVESFLAIPQFVVGTDRVALVQERLVAEMRRGHRLRTVPCPFDVIPLVEALWWHPSQQLEPGHAWLRSVVLEAARGVDTSFSPQAG
ncbi:LysR family transcriptional regulator [Cellulomonas fimi]|uniref:Transcriptional regulator, LysR family n=1 Tax=Cellulomonas fimi (strain ATCC 484 / DSM 20113 / JCM 1341 / CCUG 24087 / LMG 16345 / NBRC 15513 / NCIMB 8980 / NCTC 7547 / NRS-133) TaxID=590998 RepID=F4GYK2_CELFA|nr:LysR family transcriptional regulator [Cellulomonas fimi]AEE47119.1 transcriptional regulator, LysR family [Cellulomonas fimi ATCC 484]NNH05611.1 LysR family transcriptional regulator [Cellulomonas fimi]VEH35309.1 Nodulation protein D 2 [Cellulomonas fimi]